AWFVARYSIQLSYGRVGPALCKNRLVSSNPLLAAADTRCGRPGAGALSAAAASRSAKAAYLSLYCWSPATHVYPAGRNQGPCAMDMRGGDCSRIGSAPGTLSCALTSAAVKVSDARSAGRE